MLLKYEISLRDPVHNYIPCTSLERALIDTKIFQRLKRIGQSSSRFVYHGAEHSRFGHSIGVMHIAGKMAQSLLIKNKLGGDFYLLEKLKQFCDKGKDFGFPHIEKLSNDLFTIARQVQIIRIAGLLHDIGHPPFSHVIEPIIQKYQQIDHEIMTIRLLEESEEINKILNPEDGHKEAKLFNIRPNDIVTIFKKELPLDDKFLREIISGPFDADKIDYLKRDSYYTGTAEFGTIDEERLIDTLRVYNNTIIPDSSAVETVLRFWEARFNIFSAVYYHRAVRAMDLIIQEMIDSFLQTYDKLEKKPTTILSALLKLEHIKDYLQLDDYSIISELSRLSREYPEKFERSSKFLDMFLKRKLLTKAVEERVTNEELWRDRRYTKEFLREEISKHGIPRELIFVDTPQEVKIDISPILGKKPKDMIIFDKSDNCVRRLEKYDLSAVNSLSKIRGFFRIYTTEEYKDKVMNAWTKIREG